MPDSPEDCKKLKISSLEIEGKVTEIPVSDLLPGHETSVNFPDAIVVYLDVLGFSSKRDSEDIESTLVDFSAPLAVASTKSPNVRFNVFSDCAFVATSLKNVQELVGSVRYAFSQWVADGILVRGGIAIGDYRETTTIAIKASSKNFIGSLFAGSGVFDAVRLEGKGRGAFLFTNDKTALFFTKQFGEGCYKVKNQLLLGWSDEERVLAIFLAISLWRLSKILASRQTDKEQVKEILINNITYSLIATNSPLPYAFMLAVLSSKFISRVVKQKVVKLFNINIRQEKIKYKELINVILNHRDFMWIKGIADLDSSVQ